MSGPGEEKQDIKTKQEIEKELYEKVYLPSVTEGKKLVQTQYPFFNQHNHRLSIFENTYHISPQTNESIFHETIKAAIDEVITEKTILLEDSIRKQAINSAFIRNLFAQYPKLREFYPKDYATFSGYNVKPVKKLPQTNVCWAYALKALHRYYGHVKGGSVDQLIEMEPQYQASDGMVTSDTSFMNKYNLKWTNKEPKMFAQDIFIPDIKGYQNTLKKYGVLYVDEMHDPEADSGHALLLSGVSSRRKNGLILRIDNNMITVNDYSTQAQWFKNKSCAGSVHSLTYTGHVKYFIKTYIKSLLSQPKQYMKNLFEKEVVVTDMGWDDDVPTEEYKLGDINRAQNPADKDKFIYSTDKVSHQFFTGAKYRRGQFLEKFSSPQILEAIMNHIIQNDPKVNKLLDKARAHLAKFSNDFQNQNYNQAAIALASVKNAQKQYRNYLRFTVFNNHNLPSIQSEIRGIIQNSLPDQDTPSAMFPMLKKMALSQLMEGFNNALRKGLYKEAELWMKGVQAYYIKFNPQMSMRLRLLNFIAETKQHVDRLWNNAKSWGRSSRIVGTGAGGDFFISLLPEWLQWGTQPYWEWVKETYKYLGNLRTSFYIVNRSIANQFSHAMKYIAGVGNVVVFACQNYVRTVAWPAIWSGLTGVIAKLGTATVGAYALVVLAFAGVFYAIGRSIKSQYEFRQWYKQLTGKDYVPKSATLRGLEQQVRLHSCDMGNYYNYDFLNTKYEELEKKDTEKLGELALEPK